MRLPGGVNVGYALLAVYTGGADRMNSGSAHGQCTSTMHSRSPDYSTERKTRESYEPPWFKLADILESSSLPVDGRTPRQPVVDAPLHHAPTCTHPWAPRAC